MPEPNRAPWLVEPELEALPFARLIGEGVRIGLLCHACRRRVVWTAEDLSRRFPGRPRLTFKALAPRLRCGVCKSEWVQVARLRPASRPPGGVSP